MNKLQIAICWLFALQAPAYAENSPTQPVDASTSQSAPARPAGDPAASEPKKDTGAAHRVDGEEGPRAAGAGPSVPREGIGAATSGSNSEPGRPPSSPKSEDRAR